MTVDLPYRRDIDGLRAVAVLPVVLFHAGVPGFSGGYVGVDVFFVISGYLITGLIADEIADRRFSLLRFYERRARRILPALFVVLAATAMAGYAILLPSEYARFGRSLLATLGFGSNVHFWLESNYFAPGADTLPLLHTWSLAVEEQFYLLFPLLLLLLRRRVQAVPVCLALLLMSLAVAEYELLVEPESAFYLLPARAAELMIGALLALGFLPPARSRWVGEALGAAGLLAIIVAVVTFDHTTTFPGLAALLPCLGAAAIIQAGTAGSSLVGRGLALSPFVGIGLVSYSLYLWHWPLLVLARLHAIRPLEGWETALLLAAALALAAASWRWVEQPVRRRGGWFGRWRVFAFSAGGAAVLAAAGLVLVLGQGLPERLPQRVVALAAEKTEIGFLRRGCMGFRLLRRGEPCRLGAADAEPRFLFWGDSHAAVLGVGLDRVARERGLAGLAAMQGGCPPLVDLVPRDNGANCQRISEAALALALSGRVEAVILHARWALYVEGSFVGRETDAVFGFEGVPLGQNGPAFRQALDTLVTRLQAAGVAVYLVAGTPEIGVDVPLVLARLALRDMTWDFAPNRAAVEARNAQANAILRGVAAAHDLLLVEPVSLLCDDARCPVERDGRPLYYDDDHLSLYGADLAAASLLPILDALER